MKGATPMLSIVFWVAFGATIGWTAAIIREQQDARQVGGYVVIGAIGGLVGGFVGGLLDPTAAGYHTTTTDIMFAVFGATALLFLMGLVRQRGSDQEN